MENKTALLDGYISITVTAEELGLHVRTLKRWKTRNYGPPSFSIGQRTFYRRADIATWLANLGAPSPAAKSLRKPATPTLPYHSNSDGKGVRL